MPGIDLLVITHDHWDHLDYGTATGCATVRGHVHSLGVGDISNPGWIAAARPRLGRMFALSAAALRYIAVARHFSDVRSTVRRCGLDSSSKLRRPEFSATAGTIPRLPTSHASFRIWMSPWRRRPVRWRTARYPCFRPISGRKTRRNLSVHKYAFWRGILDSRWLINCTRRRIPGEISCRRLAALTGPVRPLTALETAKIGLHC